MTYALDTNTIIHYLSGKSSVMAQFHNAAKSKAPLVIPVVVDFEVARGFCHRPNFAKETTYNKIRTNCPTIELNAAIWKCAASLWANLHKANRTIGDADIIIAATCITNGYTLVTDNTKHFQGITGLNVVSWA